VLIVSADKSHDFCSNQRLKLLKVEIHRHGLLETMDGLALPTGSLNIAR
jgi:hypothetical protein